MLVDSQIYELEISEAQWLVEDECQRQGTLGVDGQQKERVVDSTRERGAVDVVIGRDRRPWPCQWDSSALQSKIDRGEMGECHFEAHW